MGSPNPEDIGKQCGGWGYCKHSWDDDYEAATGFDTREDWEDRRYWQDLEKLQAEQLELETELELYPEEENRH